MILKQPKTLSKNHCTSTLRKCENSIFYMRIYSLYDLSC